MNPETSVLKAWVGQCLRFFNGFFAHDPGRRVVLVLVDGSAPAAVTSGGDAAKPFAYCLV